MSAYPVVDPQQLYQLVAPAIDALPLTPRLRDILLAIGAGLRTHDIAISLGVSPFTAETEMKELYRRLDVSGHRGVRSIIVAMLIDVAKSAQLTPASEEASTEGHADRDVPSDS